MYEALVSVSFLWLIMIKNIVLPPIKHKNIINIHMQKFYVILKNTIVLHYIEGYYCENLILEYYQAVVISINQSAPDDLN